MFSSEALRLPWQQWRKWVSLLPIQCELHVLPQLASCKGMLVPLNNTIQEFKCPYGLLRYASAGGAFIVFDVAHCRGSFPYDQLVPLLSAFCL